MQWESTEVKVEVNPNTKYKSPIHRFTDSPILPQWSDSRWPLLQWNNVYQVFNSLHNLCSFIDFTDAGLSIATHCYPAVIRFSSSPQRDSRSWLAAEMQNRLIEWYQEDQFASANLNRVDLFEIKGKRSLLPKSTYELPSQVSCISCNASRGVVAVGQQSGNISFLQSETTSSVRQFMHKDSAKIEWIWSMIT